MSYGGAASNVLDLAKPGQGGSRILTAWKAEQEQRRRQVAADRELANSMAQFRRIGGRTQPARAVDVMARSLPQPAFGKVSGERAFSAAATSRLTSGWASFGTGINADLESALAALVARSRDWAMNTDMGRRYLTLVQDNVPGPNGPTLQVRARLADGEKLDEAGNQAVELAWYQWCQRGNCEVTGRLSFADVCRAVIACDARDGEHLVRRLRQPKSKDFTHGYALQLLDVDRITPKSFAPAAGRNQVTLGVELNDLGKPVALHLYSAHPGDSSGNLAPKPIADRVLIGDVFHGFISERPEQVRGYPWASAVLLSANQLATYKQYALVAAKIGAAKMGFYVTDKDVLTNSLSLEELRDATGELVQDVEAGMVEALPPGVTFESFDPDYPHQNFGNFVDDHSRGIAAGLNVAHHNLTGNMTGVNYSSARIAELAERAHWRSLQRWHIQSFVRPVFEEWLRMALLTQSIRLPSGAPLPADRWEKFATAASFQPRSWAWVDPKNDVETAEISLRNDMKSLRQINDEQGVDLDEVLQDKARLKARYEELDLPLPSWLQAAPAAGAAPIAQGAAA
jgi:lambda family phage portal protein